MARNLPPDEYREVMRLYMKRRYDERMAHAIEYLGGKCASCGSTEDLEIDHIDPSTKVFTISSGTTLGLKRFMAEVEKCQLLCKPCHIEKTVDEQSVEHGGGKSGKQNCLCEPCRATRSAYMKARQIRIKNQQPALV